MGGEAELFDDVGLADEEVEVVWGYEEGLGVGVVGFGGGVEIELG